MFKVCHHLWIHTFVFPWYLPIPLEFYHESIYFGKANFFLFSMVKFSIRNFNVNLSYNHLLIRFFHLVCYLKLLVHFASELEKNFCTTILGKDQTKKGCQEIFFKSLFLRYWGKRQKNLKIGKNLANFHFKHPWWPITSNKKNFEANFFR